MDDILYNNIYEDLTIHIYNDDRLEARDIRTGKVSAIRQLAEKLQPNPEIHTFTPQSSISHLIEKLGFSDDKIYYFFSGKDIGSNKLRNITVMNIIAEQTYPKIMRVLYNHIMLGMPLQQANHPHKDLAELHWMSRNLAQLIGRTALRKHEHIPIDIHLYVINEQLVYYLRESFFYGCNIIIHSAKSGKTKRTSHTIFAAIESDIQINISTNVSSIVKTFYTSEKSVTEFLSKNKPSLTKLAEKYQKQYIKPKRKPAIIS